MRKKLLLLCLALICLLPVLGSAVGTAETSGPYQYTIHEDGTTCTITDYTGSAQTVTFPSSLEGYTVTEIGKENYSSVFSYNSPVTSITVPDTVTKIKNYAFSSCKKLETAVLPDSVTELGKSAFSYCESLTSVRLPQGLDQLSESLFSGCSSLPSIAIPAAVTEIPDYCFYGCSALQDISLPAGLIKIGYNAFYGCAALSSIDLPDSVTEIESMAFGNTGFESVTIRKNIQYGSYGTYSGCEKLTSVSFETGITTIPESCCYGMKAVTEISIPGTVTSIGDSAFYSCQSLVSIDIPGSVTSIGSSAFYNCKSLISIDIPDSVTSIGSSAFYYCKSLISIDIPDSVTSIGYSAFSYCESLTDVRLPSGVKNLSYCFSGCSSLKRVQFPAALESLGGSFSNCKALEEIDLSNTKVKYLSNGEFGHCESLRTIVLPACLTSIGDYAFQNCTSLTRIAIPAAVTQIGRVSSWSGTIVYESPFDGCTALEAIELAEGNQNYVIWEGGLYTKGKTVLIAYPAARVTDVLTLPEGLTAIARYAIQDAQIGTLSLPDSLVSLSDISMGSAILPHKITAYAVSASHPAFSVRNGALYSKDGTSLIACPGGFTGEFTVPDGVTAIGDNAFENVSGMTAVHLPNSVSTFGMSSFSNCTGLSTITIPEGVTTLSWVFNNCTGLESVYLPLSLETINYSFSYCSSLQDIYYAGTMDEWSEVTVNSYGGNEDYFLKAKLHASDSEDLGDPIASGGTDSDQITWALYENGLFVVQGSGMCYSLRDCSVTSREVKEIVVRRGITGLGWSVLRDFSQATKITFPEGYKEILSSSFNWSTLLEEVHLPASLTSIGQGAFSNSPVLRDVYYGGTVSQWHTLEESIAANNTGITSRTTVHCKDGEIEYPYGGSCGENAVWTLNDEGLLTVTGTGAINQSAFSNNTDIVRAVIEEGITSIGRYAFSSCNNMVSISMPDSLESIDDGAFQSCQGLEEMTFPKNLISLGMNVFGGANNVSAFHTAEDSVSFIAESGVLYSKDMTTLVACPPNMEGEFTVPASVTRIGGYAFDACRKITGINLPTGLKEIEQYSMCSLNSLVIPDGVTNIGAYAFGSVSSLTIPASVQFIGRSAFLYNSMQDIYYGGTKAQWNAIERDADEAEGFLFSSLVTIHCTDGEIHTGTLVQYSDDHRYYVDITGAGQLYSSACSQANNLLLAWVGEGITVLRSSAFSSCTQLTAIQLPSTLTKIDYYCFQNCGALRDVYFLGTQEQWQQITIGQYNDSLNNAEVHFGASLPIPTSSPEEFTYERGNGFARITGYTGAAKLLHIPAELGGLPVTEIKAGAFRNSHTITEVTVPEGVKIIGSRAFDTIRSLKSISLPSTLTTIQYAAFDYCSNLKHVYYAGDTESWNALTIGTSNDYLLNATLHCVQNYTTLTLPAALTAIGEEAFAGLNGHALEFILPDGCVSIGSGAFRSAAQYLRIILPESVSSIDDHAFDQCGEVIFVLQSNSRWISWAQSHDIQTEIQP